MIEWLDDEREEDVGTYAGILRSGQGILSWLALAAPTQADLPDGQTDFVASSATIDRYGDSIDQQTWILKHYRRNPVVLYEHGMSPAHGTLVVGKSVRVGITQLDEGTKQLRSRIQWDVGDHNLLGSLVWAQHKNGFRSAVSVGFKPHEAKSRTELDAADPLYVDGNKTPRWKAGYVYRFNELYEISTVAVPGNQEALQLSVEIGRSEDVDSKVRTTVRDLLPAAVHDAMLTSLQRSAAMRRAVLVAIMGQSGPGSPDLADNPTLLRWVGK